MAALVEMYVQGVSTRKVKAVSEELCGHESLRPAELSFFSLADRLAQISRQSDPLARLSGVFDWPMFQPVLDRVFPPAEARVPVGARPTPSCSSARSSCSSASTAPSVTTQPWTSKTNTANTQMRSAQSVSMKLEQPHGAQLNLGVMYDYGRGMPKDETEVCKWYLLSGAQGNDTARKNYTILERTLTPQRSGWRGSGWRVNSGRVHYKLEVGTCPAETWTKPVAITKARPFEDVVKDVEQATVLVLVY